MISTRQAYVKTTGLPVVAVQLELDTEGFTYEKWGGTQTCKAGDWVVNNAGEVYTVDADTFARTYRLTSLGLYEKVTPVWAEVAQQNGMITTKEGVTHYDAGAYLVFNERDGGDGYAVTADQFEKMYKPLESSP